MPGGQKIKLGAQNANMSIYDFCETIISDKQFKLTKKQRAGLEDYISIIQKLKDLVDKVSLRDLFDYAISSSGYLDVLKKDNETFEDRNANLKELLNKAQEWEERDKGHLKEFLEELSLKASLDDVADVHKRLNLMTIHNGKGLEFFAAFMAGMEEGLFPHANSFMENERLEEERRLCYVGMTRAKSKLHLISARSRNLWGDYRRMEISRFLNEIPERYVSRKKTW